MGAVLCGLSLSGCAAKKPVPDAVQTAADDDNLGSAFEPPPEEPANQKVDLPPLVDRTKPFKEAFAAATAARRSGNDTKAVGLAEELVRLADALGGAERRAAYDLLAGLSPGNAKVAQAWYEACGPEELERCRQDAAAAIPGAEGKAYGRVEECLAQAEAGQHEDPCLANIRSLPQAQDEVTRARMALAHGLGEKQEAARRTKLEKVETSCSERGCAYVRRKALQALTKDALAKGEIERATRYALRESQIWSKALDTADAPWARQDDLIDLCAKYDAKNGAGACRRFEKSLNGGYTFVDFSKGGGGTTGLDPETVKKVNAHYGVLLEGCLGEQALRMTPPQQARFDVRWMVVNDGRVSQVEVPQLGAEHPLTQCLKKQFLLWRYPKYEGEYQHVEQSFTVTAAVRRR